MADTPPIPVFDLGDVFVEWDPMLLFRKLFPTEEDAQWFRDNVYSNGLNLEFDAGDSFAEGDRPARSRAFRDTGAKFRHTTCAGRKLSVTFIQGTIDIHDELIAADIPTFAITNFSLGEMDRAASATGRSSKSSMASSSPGSSAW